MSKTRVAKIRAAVPPPEQAAAYIGALGAADVLSRLLKLHNCLLAPFSAHVEKRHKISLNEFRMLMSIGRLGTTASHELARITGVNTMSVSRAVAVLHRHGRIKVDTDPDNRRRKTLRLTPAGRRLYEQMLPATDNVARYLFEALRPDEIMAFDHFVRTLTQRLEARDEKGKLLFVERTRPEGAPER